VFRLLEPFIDKGHTIFMDNYYNSVCLANQLLLRETHTTGTLRSNRKENPKCVLTKKLKTGEYLHIASQRKRNGKINAMYLQ